MMITLRHEDGDEQTVMAWSMTHYELRHMGYKEVKMGKTMRAEDIKRMKEVLDRVTSGPWRWRNPEAEKTDPYKMPYLEGPNGEEILDFGVSHPLESEPGGYPNEDDSEFIAMSRDLVPSLIEEIQEYRKKEENECQAAMKAALRVLDRYGESYGSPILRGALKTTGLSGLGRDGMDMLAGKLRDNFQNGIVPSSKKRRKFMSILNHYYLTTLEFESSNLEPEAAFENREKYLAHIKLHNILSENE
jgi:hypothetical protein